MLFTAFVVGGFAGWVFIGGEIGALAGAIIGAAIGLIVDRRSRAAHRPKGPVAGPVDLSVATPARLTAGAYAAMPLAARNATVARLVAGASGVDLDAVVALLPNLMERTKADTDDLEKIRQTIMSASREISPVLRGNIRTVCDGELRLAARASLPQTDPAREFATRSLSGPPTESALRRAALKAQLGNGQSLADLIDDVVAGRKDLTFAVGTIRQVGQLQAAEFAKIR